MLGSLVELIYDGREYSRDESSCDGGVGLGGVDGRVHL